MSDLVLPPTSGGGFHTGQSGLLVPNPPAATQPEPSGPAYVEDTTTTGMTVVHEHRPNRAQRRAAGERGRRRRRGDGRNTS